MPGLVPSSFFRTVHQYSISVFILTAATAWFAPNCAVAQSAEQFLSHGHFPEALVAAKAVRNALPPDTFHSDTAYASAHLWFSKSYQALANTSKAIQHIDSAVFYIGADRSSLFYQIENQYGLLKNDIEKINGAIGYFENKDEKLTADCLISLGFCYLRRNKREAQDVLSKCERLLLSSLPYDSVLLAKCRQYLGYYYWKMEKNYDKALSFFRLSEQIFLQTGGLSNNYLAPLHVNMGACLDEMGDPRKAIRLYKNAEANFVSQNEYHPNLLSIYNNLGNSYGDLGDYALAIRYLQKAVEAAPQSSKGRYLNNLGDACLGKGDYPAARICFDSALIVLLAAPKPDSVEIARPYHNLAVICRNNGEYKKALDLEMLSLPFRKSNLSGFLDIARTYTGISETFVLQEKYADGLIYADSALRLQYQKIPSRIYYETSSVFLSKAKCHSGLLQFEQAMIMVDSALLACGYGKLGRFDEVIAPPELLSALEFKGKLLFGEYRQSNNLEYLRAAAAAYDTAAIAVQYFRNTLLDGASKADLVAQFRDIISGGIEVALSLHVLFPGERAYFDQAFSFTEQSKSLLLMEGMRTAGKVKFDGVDEQVIEQERTLMEALTDAEIKVRALLERTKSPTDSLLLQAKNVLFHHQQAFESFQQSLQSPEYAQYYRFRFGVSTVKPENVQKDLLTPDRSLLSYYTGQNGTITAFVINQQGIRVVQCPVTPDLEKQVEKLRGGLLEYYTTLPAKRTETLYEKTVRQYISAAQSLYTTLLAPVDSFLKGEVVIVPDDVLGYIPFELLLTGAPSRANNFSTYPYWFKEKKRQVSYAYSATLLNEMVQKQHRLKASLPILAMAPFYPGSASDLEKGNTSPVVGTSNVTGGPFPDLKYSGGEVRDIARLWGGVYRAGKTVSKQSFLDQASGTAILHLSTHGVLDKSAEFSWLAFAPLPGSVDPEPLYVSDLYNMQLNADLVTLSACETGIGTIQRGEGVISVARAFAFAGAKSIVTSLWQVNDAATTELMVDFYTRVKSGKTKDEALDQSKRAYIEKHPGAQAHPFFWAGFIGIGDMRKM